MSPDQTVGGRCHKCSAQLFAASLRLNLCQDRACQCGSGALQGHCFPLQQSGHLRCSQQRACSARASRQNDRHSCIKCSTMQRVPGSIRILHADIASRNTCASFSWLCSRASSTSECLAAASSAAARAVAAASASVGAAGAAGPRVRAGAGAGAGCAAIHGFRKRSLPCKTCH